jgi:hypothetical protein
VTALEKTVCSCTSGQHDCSCYFASPPQKGTYLYYACIDKNGDGDFNDQGESSSSYLTVPCTSCSKVSPNVKILTPFTFSGGDLTASVSFQCCQWSSSVNDLVLSLRIDNAIWKECFLHKNI